MEGHRVDGVFSAVGVVAGRGGENATHDEQRPHASLPGNQWIYITTSLLLSLTSHSVPRRIPYHPGAEKRQGACWGGARGVGQGCGVDAGKGNGHDPFFVCGGSAARI